MFQDVMDGLRKRISNLIPDIREEDIGFDQSGHADLSLRLFRYNGFEPDALKKAILEEKFVTSVIENGKYMNIRIDPVYILRSMVEAVDTSGQFPDTFQDPERVCVEHTSINPTGPIHIGRSRNSIIGDSLSRLLKRYGNIPG